MKPNWLSIRNEGDISEILIQGPIGSSFWDDSGMSAKEFTDELTKIPAGKKITIGVNSEGGSIKDGLGIYNAIKRRREDITTRVDGYAVSIASIVALAGSKVVSPKSSIWMIHEPWSMTVGNAEDHLKAAQSLQQHAETLVSIYQEETGQTEDAVRAAMKEEKWFRGDEAVEWGLADEVSDQNAMLNALDFTKYKNPPETILRSLVAVQGAAPGSAKPQPKVKPHMETTTPVAEPTVPPVTTQAAAPSPPAQPTQQLDVASVMAAIKTLSEKVDAIQSKQQPEVQPIRAAGTAKVVREGLRDILAEHPDPKDRFEFLKREFTSLAASGHPLQPHNLPVAANTDTAAGVLTTATLASGVITVLQNKLAFLRAFTTVFEVDRVKPKAVIEVPIVTAGGTAVATCVNYEDATNFVNTVDDVLITPLQYTVGAHITNTELNNGWRMGWWIETKMTEMGVTLKALVNAIITTGNFTGTPVVSASAAFGADELKTLWGQLKKASLKNILMDGEYYARFLPNDLESFNPLVGSTYPGWDNFLLDTYWTGATANTTGFACNPQAICVGMGMPLMPPNAPGGSSLTQTTVSVPGLNISVILSEWFSTISRTSWWTVDVMFGAAKGDPAAGILIMSA